MKKIITIILIILIVIIGIIFSVRENRQKKQEQENSSTMVETEELEEIEGFLNDIENNGFLMSEYNNPNEIDLSSVIYNGAGKSQTLTEKQEEEYKTKVGKERIYLNITSLKKDDIEKLFLEKTGEKLQNIDEKLKEWIYLENDELYCKEHGDSNYIQVEKCRIGKKKDNIYTIYLKFENGMNKYSKVTLKKQGDTYIFVSNEFVKN